MRICNVTTIILAAVAWAVSAQAEAPPAWFQAHRGGLDEVPENTLAALRHAWAIPGAVPEVDVQVTSDGELVLIHDDTLARTTDAPESIRTTPISKLTYDRIEPLDAGAWFAAEYAGEKVPRLSDALKLLMADSERKLYLDVKDTACLDAIEAELFAYEATGRVLFVHGDPRVCAQLRARFDAPTMTWISGSPNVIRRRFAEMAQTGFAGISQLQFHLRAEEIDGQIVYALDDAFLRESAALLDDGGVSLQVRPFLFDGPSLARLLDMGIRWYVADAPQAFHDALAAAARLREPVIGTPAAGSLK